MRKVIILQARLASSRFPNKVLAELNGRPMIAHIIDRLKESRLADSICAAIPADASEDRLAAALAHHGVTITRGHATDVLGRYIQAAYQTGAQVIVRATADNPLVSPENIDRQIEALSADPECDYVFTNGLPVGVSTECFTLKTLEKLDYLSREGNLREHVTLYLRQHPGTFNSLTLEAPPELHDPDLRLTVDTPADFEVVKAIYGRLYKPGHIVDVAAALSLLQQEPALLQEFAAA
jgi:spore coat polysaccharide biosynthesis protein SpsF